MAQSYHKAMRASGTRYIPELKERVEAEEYAEPLSFGPYLDEDGELHETTYRMLVSKSFESLLASLQKRRV